MISIEHDRNSKRRFRGQQECRLSQDIQLRATGVDGRPRRGKCRRRGSLSLHVCLRRSSVTRCRFGLRNCFIPVVLNECNPAVRANIKSKSKSSVCCACKQGVECDVHRRAVDDEVVRRVLVITLLGFKGGLFGIHTCCIHYRPSIRMVQSISSSGTPRGGSGPRSSYRA